MKSIQVIKRAATALRLSSCVVVAAVAYAAVVTAMVCQRLHYQNKAN
jgi:hypothetical protein